MSEGSLSIAQKKRKYLIEKYSKGNNLRATRCWLKYQTNKGLPNTS